MMMTITSQLMPSTTRSSSKSREKMVTFPSPLPSKGSRTKRMKKEDLDSMKIWIVAEISFLTKLIAKIMIAESGSSWTDLGCHPQRRNMMGQKNRNLGVELWRRNCKMGNVWIKQKSTEKRNRQLRFSPSVVCPILMHI